MRINRFVVAGGVIGGVIGVVVGYFVFASKAYPEGSIVCGPGRCIVPVSVTEGCVPKPDGDPIIVLKQNGATNIFWEAPTGYTFTDPDGIKFKDNNSGDVDPRPGRINGGAVWHVVDNPAHQVKIQYRIEVQTNGKVCTGPDPVIWNQ